MRTIPYQSYFDFGKGVDSIAEIAKGQAVEITQAGRIQGGGGQSIQFRLDIVESQQHFQKALGVSASASLRFGLPSVMGGQINAKYEFAEECSYNEYNLNILVRVRVSNPVLMLRNPKLTNEAADLYSRDILAFQNKYGDSFISGLHTGGEFFGLLIIETKDSESKEKIYANLQAEGAYGAWGGAFGTKYQSEELKKVTSKNTQAFVLMTGGSGRIEIDPNSLISKAQDFPNLVNAAPDGNGWPYFVDLMEYNLIDLPQSANVIDIEKQRELLTLLGLKRTEALTKLKKCQYIKLHPDEFIDLSSEVINRLDEAERQLSDVLEAIYRQASSCFNDYRSCNFSASDFVVPHVVFPQRIFTAKPEQLQIEVPHLIGLTTEEALAKLKSVGLTAKNKDVITHLYNLGKVVDQNPVHKSSIVSGGIVEIGIGISKPGIRNGLNL